MSYGTKKAIAGVMKAGEHAAAGVEECIHRFDAAGTADEIRDVLAWAKRRGGFFYRTKEQDERMYAAYLRAKARAADVERQRRIDEDKAGDSCGCS